MNKTAIITGGATGIGRAISSALCRKGYNVVIAYNTSEKAAEQLVKQLNSEGLIAVSYKTNVSDRANVSSLFDFTVKEFGEIDVLVNNAGIAQQKLLTDITSNDWNSMLSVNLTGCFTCCQEAAKVMISQHFGSIINVSSMWGIIGASCESHYAAAKAGVISLTKSLAKELGPSGIRVNCIAPGVIKTDMLNGFTEQDLQALIEETPLMRLGTPEDVANTALFLASESSSFITGQTISVDGGFVI